MVGGAISLPVCELLELTLDFAAEELDLLELEEALLSAELSEDACGLVLVLLVVKPPFELSPPPPPPPHAVSTTMVSAAEKTIFKLGRARLVII